MDRLAGRRRLVFAGIGDALNPASSVVEGLTFIGFVGFFVWMAAMGVSLLRGHPPEAPVSPRRSGPKRKHPPEALGLPAFQFHKARTPISATKARSPTK